MTVSALPLLSCLCKETALVLEEAIVREEVNLLVTVIELSPWKLKDRGLLLPDRIVTVLTAVLVKSLL